MGVIQGRSPWRAFVLPFTNDDSWPNPYKLDVNLVLPGDGTVWLTDLRLVQMEPTAIAAAGKPENLSGLMNDLIAAVTSMIRILVVAITLSVTIFFWYRLHFAKVLPKS